MREAGATMAIFMGWLVLANRLRPPYSLAPMTPAKSYFFIGIGGSGMLPLALILKGPGPHISGSDRSLDQGRTPEKFAWLRGQGFRLFAQDGSGVTDANTIVVASAAVEDTVPDMAAARKIGAKVLSRAELLSRLFNEAKTS